MPTLSEASIAELLTPFYPAPPARLLSQLSAYLDLLLKWNARTNLSAIREPEAIVTRHFGESLFLASRLPSARTLLDLGSGAGFPGLPCALVRPELMVTLAESQNKKASFLREVARTLAVDVEIWDKRAELLLNDRRFDIVALRAVDNPEAARMTARALLAHGGVVAELTGTAGSAGTSLQIPESARRFLTFAD